MVYKFPTGEAKPLVAHSISSQSPAMILDRSVVSLRLTWVTLTILTGCRNSTNKTCDIRGGPIFGRQRHNLNKFCRGLQDDATNIISRLVYA